MRIARGSLYKTRHWLRRAHARHLMSIEEVKTVKPILDELGPKLNSYFRSIGPVAKFQNDDSTAAPIFAKDK